MMAASDGAPRPSFSRERSLRRLLLVGGIGARRVTALDPIDTVCFRPTPTLLYHIRHCCIIYDNSTDRDPLFFPSCVCACVIWAGPDSSGFLSACRSGGGGLSRLVRLCRCFLCFVVCTVWEMVLNSTHRTMSCLWRSSARERGCGWSSCHRSCFKYFLCPLPAG
ncbi:unnamed protein product [Scytosiphon promiscuus]